MHLLYIYCNNKKQFGDLYQMGNQNPQTQWPKGRQSTKHYIENKNRGGGGVVNSSAPEG